MSAINAEGGCACGAVRYRLKAEPIVVNCCHCNNCQRQTGSAFAVNAVIETANVELLSGDVEVVSVPREGAPHDIHRCPKCRTAVWSDYGRRPGVRFVRVGTLDDNEALRPTAHIFTKAKVPWLQLSGDIPAYEEFYDVKKAWSREAMVRWLRAVPSKK